MLIELIAAMAIIFVLATMAVPLARVQIIRSRETELRADLREMRTAIDQYKRYADAGLFQKKADSNGYPPDLETLVEGVPWPGQPDTKFKFLRRIPIDPMTGHRDWGLRAMQDDLDSRSWGGQNVFDVYSKSDKTALDGTLYADW
jgi:general secretion pathway protein G